MTRLTPLLLLALVGCTGARPEVEMTEVSGTVTVNGKPAETLILTLTPLTPGEGREDECVVQNGQFRTKLMPAKYRVSFVTGPKGSAVAKMYRAPETSGLELDGTKSIEGLRFELR